MDRAVNVRNSVHGRLRLLEIGAKTSHGSYARNELLNQREKAGGLTSSSHGRYNNIDLWKLTVDLRTGPSHVSLPVLQGQPH